MIAEVAHWLATPVSDLMEMEWGEVLLWHDEARKIAQASPR